MERISNLNVDSSELIFHIPTQRRHIHVLQLLGEEGNYYAMVDTLREYGGYPLRL